MKSDYAYNYFIVSSVRLTTLRGVSYRFCLIQLLFSTLLLHFVLVLVVWLPRIIIQIIRLPSKILESVS